MYFDEVAMKLLGRPQKTKTFRKSKKFTKQIKTSKIDKYSDHSLYIYSFLIIRTVSWLSKQFPEYFDTFLIIWRVFKSSGQFPDHMDSFLICRTVSWISGQFPDCSADRTVFWFSWLSGQFWLSGQHTSYLSYFLH